MSVIITKFSKDDIVEMSGVMSIMNAEMNNIKSVEDLLEKIQETKIDVDLDVGQERHYNNAVDDIIEIVKEYCEVQ